MTLDELDKAARALTATGTATVTLVFKTAGQVHVVIDGLEDMSDSLEGSVAAVLALHADTLDTAIASKEAELTALKALKG